MSWEKVRLGDLFDYENKSHVKAGDGLLNGKYPFYTSSNILSKYLNEFLFEKKSLIFGTGGNASIHFAEIPFSVSTDCLVAFSKDEKRCYTKYVFFYLMGNINLLEEGFKGAGLKHISKSFIKELLIPLPPLPTQKRIADILDTADALRRKDQELLTKYDQLAQAIFIDMFGDPVKNEKGWELVSLDNYGSFKNGLNYKSNDVGIQIKYLGVGDFKSKYKIDDIESLNSIELNSIPNEGYILKNGDLVFVRSNGNKELVGRCVEVFPNQSLLTFSGFCIRYRLNSKEFLSSYLTQLFKNKSFKNVMLTGGRGANIQNINQEILSSIKIPKPDFALQELFVQFIQSFEVQKSNMEMSIQNSTSLFSSLIQQAFNGTLVS